jgi:hypothetical protein
MLAFLNSDLALYIIIGAALLMGMVAAYEVLKAVGDLRR